MLKLLKFIVEVLMFLAIVTLTVGSCGGYDNGTLTFMQTIVSWILGLALAVGLTVLDELWRIGK